MSFPHNKPNHSCFPSMSSKNCSQVWPRFLWRHCFALGPSEHESLCMPFKNGVSISPSPVELLHTSPTGLQVPDAPGALSPSARSPHVRVWCGAQNSHSCRWVSVNQLVSSLWSFPPRRYGVVYIVKSPLLPLDVASSFSSGVGYLFESFQSIWLKIAQHSVVNFIVFRREVELQSFYSPS